MKRGPQLSVGAVVIEDSALLMVRRAKEPSKGMWSLPGGRVKWGESLKAALKREVREETGLEVEADFLLGIWELISRDFHYVILNYRAHRVDLSEPLAGQDASEVSWVPLASLTELPVVPSVLQFLRQHGLL